MLHEGVSTVFPVGVNATAKDYSEVSEFTLPTITLDENYKVLDNDLYGAEYTSEMFYENLVAYGESIAEKYGVGFLLTEVCNDNDYPLEKYLAFEELETSYLREHKIPSVPRPDYGQPRLSTGCGRPTIKIFTSTTR